MKKARFVFLAFFLILILMPLAAFAQGAEEVPGGDPWFYVRIVFNVGIVATLVQLLKLKVLPFLKKEVPYLIPLLGMAIGVASAMVLQATGIDISPIGDVFGVGIASGALASAGFAVVKEGQNKLKRPRLKLP